MQMTTPPSHFKGKEAIEHVVAVQTEGILTSQEIHGAEAPGHLAAATDAARETAMLCVFCWLMALFLKISLAESVPLLLALAAGWTIWKFGRSAWLGWSRLERLHRVMAEEKWEIEHHREQEREELTALYAAKGFQGRLLHEVIEVLMSDDNRLLQVMLEEELGFTLQNQEHPLKQGLGALIGALIAFFLCGISIAIGWGPIPGALLTIALAGGLGAWYEGNNIIPAIVWNCGLATVAIGIAYYLHLYLTQV